MKRYLVLTVALTICVVQFGQYVIAKANFDAEYSWKLRGAE